MSTAPTAFPSRERGAAGRLARSLPLLVALVLTAAAQIFFLTDRGSKSLLRPDGHCHYYDASADALLDGRLDVHPVHIGNEAFLVGGKCYGYFGLTPAVLRIPLHAAFPRLWGCWSRLSILASSCATTILIYLFVREARRALGRSDRTVAAAWVDGGALCAYGLGTASLFIASRANVFHEAIAAAVALALATLWCLVRYLSTARLAWALAALIGCLATVHTRVVEGAGTCAAIALVLAAILARAMLPEGRGERFGRACGLPRLARPLLHALVLLAGLIGIAASHLAVNHGKFGRWSSVPYESYAQATPDRWARSEGRMFRLQNVPFNAFHYLSPTTIRFLSQRPFVRPLEPREIAEFAGARIDSKEPLVGLSVASPGILLASLAGGVLLFSRRRSADAPRAFRIPMLGALASAGIPLVYFSISNRFEHDLLPALALSGSVAVARLPYLGGRLGRWMRGLGAALTPWSAFVWWVAASRYQAEWYFVKIEPQRTAAMIPVYADYLARHGDDALVLTELGLLESSTGDPAGGLRHVQRAVEVDPDCDEAWSTLGTITARSDLAASEELFRRALRSNPHNLVARLSLASLLQARGQHGEALENLEAAVQSEPFDLLARARLEDARARQAPGR